MEKTDWQNRGAGHRQRLRDRFLERGLDGFTDAEVLELVLTLGTPRKDCKEMARALLDRFGTFAAVLEASQAELQQVKGVGAKNGFAIHFVHAVARRYLKQQLHDKHYLRSSKDVADYLIHAMRGLKREVFTVIFLDAGYGIIDSEIICEGTLTTNTIHPRELIQASLVRHAAAVVIAHNHPSGSLSPSPADRKLTRHLFLACAFAGIELLDHLIIGAAKRPFSFADQGIMDEIRRDLTPVMNGL